MAFYQTFCSEHLTKMLWNYLKQHIHSVYNHASLRYTVCIYCSLIKTAFKSAFCPLQSAVASSAAQINNRKIGKLNLLHNRIEPFPALFWALAHILYCNRGPSSPAWHPSTVVLARYCTAGVSQVQFDGRSVTPSLYCSCCPYSMLCWV